MRPDDCQLQPIAEVGCCLIAQCADCGRCALHIGPLSIRLRTQVIRDLQRCLARVLPVLDAVEMAADADERVERGLRH
jgi:hypothetical protein